MKTLRISRKPITVAAPACRFAVLASLGTRAVMPARHHGVRLAAVVAALLAALGAAGVPAPVALAGSRAVLNWTKQHPATSPGARSGATMDYDAATGNVVLFGGASCCGGLAGLGATWVWNGSAWTKQHPATRPRARVLAAMAYDAATRTVVLFGGKYTNAILGDTWTWNGSTWTQRHPATSPSAREAASMAYDAATGNAVLFGGVSTNGDFGDTWAWDGSAWTRQHPATSPPARWGASMAYDAATGNAVLFGGASGRNNRVRRDTWIWDGTTWTRQHPATSPPARVSATMAYDAATGNVILFGGVGTADRGDTWVWDGTTWTQQHPATSPPARSGAVMAYDAATRNTVLFGGEDANGDFGDTWAWGSGGTAPAH